MNRYHLVHVTEFHYDGPVSESYNEVRLRPIHDERQSCLSFRLTTNPPAPATSYRDVFGNWVQQFNILPVHNKLRIEAESVVMPHEVAGDAPASGAKILSPDEMADEFYDFLAPTDYVPHLRELDELIDAAEREAQGSDQEFAEAASQLIHQKFQYVKGATHVHSSIKDALSKAAGVCQDFAHLLLGVARKRGLPARYVSGYLVPPSSGGSNPSVEEVIGGQASHAWTEIYIPGKSWMPFDPTLGKPVGVRHVRIAYGREYGDVAPVRGVYNGHAGQRLSVDVTVRPALDNSGYEQLSNRAAGPTTPPSPDERLQQPAQQ